MTNQPQTLMSSDNHAGFTLIELMATVAIMAIMLGVLVVSLGQMQTRGLQMAATQVASGMGLARQIAITGNANAMFIVAPRSGDTSTDFLPMEAFRYWAVIRSNRNEQTWTMVTDWTELPAGSVFMGLVGQGYNTINWSPDGTLPALGSPFRPKVENNSSGAWQYFNSFTNITVSWPTGSTNLTGVPFIGFRPTGRGFVNRGGSGALPSSMAIVLGEGAAADGGSIILRSTSNITHVETDGRGGRIVVRPRESYR
jgi:prepilin-type N-terminal cleavage/methylation domain-containing protein